jgi:hypothetical protein
MLFAMRFNTPFRMFRLLTVQGGSVHVDMRFNFEKCYRRPRAGFEYNVSNIRFTISNIGYSCSLNFSSCPINA